MSSASSGVGDCPAGVFVDGRFEAPASDWLPVPTVPERAARHGGEGQTRRGHRQWIGIPTTAVS